MAPRRSAGYQPLHHAERLASAFNSLTQRVFVELDDRGHDVGASVVFDGPQMLAAVAAFEPDVIVAPYLKRVIPEELWRALPCLIVHPGIKGDWGPSSVDWAILRGRSHWGVTVLQAAAEFDAGDIWAHRTFPMRDVAKSELYRHEVADAAVGALLEALDRVGAKDWKPEPLDYGKAEIAGGLEPLMKQSDRAIDWAAPTAEVLRRMRCADSTPGVLDTIFDAKYHLFGGQEEHLLTGSPGEVLGHRDGAICRATGDGAVWISHVKRASKGKRVFVKLPASVALARHLEGVPDLRLAPDEVTDAATYREIRYDEGDGVGYLHFEFYNGAMSTVHAMDDLVKDILHTDSHLVIAALSGNAGAGGVPLALADDEVWARKGVVLNPHYKGMELFGSEYWTYLFPKRVGDLEAQQLTETRLPLGARRAKEIGLIDDVFGEDVAVFREQVARAAEAIADSPDLAARVERKRTLREQDEGIRSLSTYRYEKLAHMRRDFSAAAYRRARRAFVYKKPAEPFAHPAAVGTVIRPATSQRPREHLLSHEGAKRAKVAADTIARSGGAHPAEVRRRRVSWLPFS